MVFVRRFSREKIEIEVLSEQKDKNWIKVGWASHKKF